MMNRPYRTISLLLSILLLPSLISAAPIVAIKSSKVLLTSEVSGTMLSGGKWSLKEQTQTDLFYDARVDIFEQVNVDIDGDLDIDEAVNFFIHADFNTDGNRYYETMANAEIHWGDGDPQTPAGPLADLRDGTIDVQAKAVFKSIFKITGSSSVRFYGSVWNYEGNNNNSFGKLELWDLTTGDLVISLDDRLVNDYQDDARTLLLPDHTYKLYSLANNQTGGDEEIGVDMYLLDAAITVAEPSYLIIFSIGIMILAISRRELPIIQR